MLYNFVEINRADKILGYGKLFFRIHFPEGVFISSYGDSLVKISASENARRGFCDSARIQRDTSGSHHPRLSIRSRTVERLLVDGPQYGARLERKRTVRVYDGGWRKRGGRGRRNKMKKKKKKAALKRKVGARIETQFDPRYEAPAEVGSPRAHLT